MKTVEITRHKQASVGAPVESTFKVFQDIYKREGLAGINKGVNAVAVRQATNWGSRMGFARLAESALRKARGINEGEKLGALDKILASTVGGALATWNQPIEVVRVEVSQVQCWWFKANDQMQSAIKSVDPNAPTKKTVLNTLNYNYKTNGLKGLYRGVAPRIGLGECIVG
jgi:shikimate kinase